MLVLWVRLACQGLPVESLLSVGRRARILVRGCNMPCCQSFSVNGCVNALYATR